MARIAAGGREVCAAYPPTNSNACTASACSWCRRTRPCQPGREGRDRLVCRADRAQVRCAEQLEHGQVVLAVPAMSGRVDKGGPFGRPQDIPGPQVAVNPGRPLVGVEVAVGATGGHPVQDGRVRGREGAAVAAYPGDGGEPFVRPEGAPRVVRAQRERQRLRERAEPAVAAPAVRRATVCRRASEVGARQVLAEPDRRLLGRGDAVQADQVEMVLAHVDDVDDQRPTGGAQPAQPGCLPGEVAAGDACAGLAVDRHTETVGIGRCRAGTPESG